MDYGEGLKLVKKIKIKNNNDLISKKIGVQSQVQILWFVHRESSVIEGEIEFVKKIIRKAQETYLAPDISRKMAYLKQQFRIQNDRRKYLLTLIDYPKKIAIFEQTCRKERKLGQYDDINITIESQPENLFQKQLLKSAFDQCLSNFTKPEMLDQPLCRNTKTRLAKPQKTEDSKSKCKKLSYIIFFILLKIGIWYFFIR